VQAHRCATGYCAYHPASSGCGVQVCGRGIAGTGEGAGERFILKLPQRWASKASSGRGVGGTGAGSALGERERGRRLLQLGLGRVRYAGREDKGGQRNGRGAQARARMGV